MPYVKAKDGVDLYYEVSGQGTPFLFLSETACDGAVWNLYQVPEFARDHRVVIFDYRGTGLSGKPSIKYSTEMFADDAATVLDYLGLEGDTSGRLKDTKVPTLILVGDDDHFVVSDIAPQRRRYSGQRDCQFQARGLARRAAQLFLYGAGKCSSRAPRISEGKLDFPAFQNIS